MAQADGSGQSTVLEHSGDAIAPLPPAPSGDDQGDQPTAGGMHRSARPRRLRRTATLRRMVAETVLTTADLIYPLFVIDGVNETVPVAAMPNCERRTIDRLLTVATEVHRLGIPAIALFPALDPSLKDDRGREALNESGLIPRTIRALKAVLPDLVVIADVALDPYTTHGHDGLVDDRGTILNDPTVAVLAEMASVLAAAGADVVAPSDMMDGRVGAIRTTLDGAGFCDTSIMAYSAKYASAYYGPFRDALGSAPQWGDKRTYQMDPANGREALREAQLDGAEGADWLMVKPALAYLDVVTRLRQETRLPVAAYNVSGEYAMVKAAAARGWIDERAVVLETLLAMKRAGADSILTYHAMDAARWLQES